VTDDVLRPEIMGAGPQARRVRMANAPRAVLGLIMDLYDKAIDLVLARPHKVQSAAEAKAVLADDPGQAAEALIGRIQQIALIVAPMVRRLGRASKKIPGGKKMPWVAVATTATSVGTSLRQGVRDVQVVGSFLACRLERATGRPADPALVKSLTAQLYLSPTKAPVPAERPAMGRLLGRWLIAGVLGAESMRYAHNAIDAVERLDLRDFVSPPPIDLPPGT